MALSDIILPKGKLIVSIVDSPIGVNATSNIMNTGLVEVINDLCDSVIVGDYILYFTEGAIRFNMDTGETYYLINETYLFKQTAPV